MLILSHPQPQNPVPANTYYDHRQTPATYITYLEKVVIPDRKATIARLNLPQNLWELVVHDLHYSHKDSKVLEFIEENYLLSQYIPAGCTDVMQTCDTVADKPFKVGIKAAFGDYLFEEYAKWVALNPDSETRGQWNPRFSLGSRFERKDHWVCFCSHGQKKRYRYIKKAFSNNHQFR